MSTYPDVANGLAAGSLAAANGGDTDTTWITVGVKLLSTANNTYQGRAATMALNWHITQ